MARPLRIDWDAQPLGQIPHTVLARRLGCTEAAVRQACKARGITPSRQAHRWTPEQDRWIAMQWGAHTLRWLSEHMPGDAHSERAIYSRAARLQLGPPTRGTYSLDQAAAHLGIAAETARTLAARHGLRLGRKPLSPTRPGYGNPARERIRRHYAITEDQLERLAEALVRELEHGRPRKRPAPGLGTAQRAVLLWLVDRGVVTVNEVSGALYARHCSCAGWRGLRTHLDQRMAQWASSALHGLLRRGLVERLTRTAWRLTSAGLAKAIGLGANDGVKRPA